MPGRTLRAPATKPASNLSSSGVRTPPMKPTWLDLRAQRRRRADQVRALLLGEHQRDHVRRGERVVVDDREGGVRVLLGHGLHRPGVEEADPDHRVVALVGERRAAPPTAPRRCPPRGSARSRSTCSSLTGPVQARAGRVVEALVAAAARVERQADPDLLRAQPGQTGPTGGQRRRGGRRSRSAPGRRRGGRPAARVFLRGAHGPFSGGCSSTGTGRRRRAAGRRRGSARRRPRASGPRRRWPPRRPRPPTPMFSAICSLPSAASPTLRFISLAVAVCSSTAPAMARLVAR